MIFLIANSTLAALIILVNLIVFLMFRFKPRLTEKPSNHLLQSLSACDLVSGIVVVLHIIIGQYPGIDSFAIRVGADILKTWLVESSALHLVFITGDRALSLFYALRYRDIVTRRSIKMLIVWIWLVPFLTSACQLLYLYPYFNDKQLSEEMEENIANVEVIYSIVSFIVYMLIPLVIMFLAFFSMFYEIKKLLLRTPSTGQLPTPRVSWQQRRVIYIFGAMYMCFVFLAIPYFTLRVYIDIQMWKNKEIAVSRTTLEILYVLKTATSLFNPLLYSGLNREFRAYIILCIKGIMERGGTTLRRQEPMSNDTPTTRSRILSLEDEAQA